MQNRSVNDRVFKPSTNQCSRGNNHLLLEENLNSGEDDPLLNMNIEVSQTYDNTKGYQEYEWKPRQSSRKRKKQPSKGRKPRGKQEIQPISSNNNMNVSLYDPSSIVVNNIPAGEKNSHKLKLEEFSNKNAEAKLKKNLQFRGKLPKKSSREKSTPSRINQEY